MHPEEIQSGHDQEIKKGTRPFSCKVILAIALTYFLVIMLLFATAVIFRTGIIRAVGYYFDPSEYDPGKITLFILSGAILYLLASAGLILQSLKRRIGFYIFFIIALMILVLDLIFLDFDWLRYVIQSGLIFLVGIAHFSKRCYH